jgi:hypothetical protein
LTVLPTPRRCRFDSNGGGREEEERRGGEKRRRGEKERERERERERESIMPLVSNMFRFSLLLLPFRLCFRFP